MMLATWDRKYSGDVIALWNEEAVRDGYKELTEASFEAIFVSNAYFDPENTFVLLDAGRVIGFACGCTGQDLPLGRRPAILPASCCPAIEAAMRTIR